MRPEEAELWIVDDMASDHELIKIGFRDHVPRDRFRCFVSAEEALDALLEGGRPALMLLDLKMPGMGGFGLLEARRERKLGMVPVMVLSSSSNPDDIRASYELGANAYVEKPKDLAELMAFAESTKNFWFDWAHLPLAGQ